MENKLEANVRTDEGGKSHARKLRMAGLVPAVVYGGGGEATRVAVRPKALFDLFDATKNRNTVLTLDIGGDSVPVLVGEVQRHPLDRTLVHVDFIRVSEDRPVTVMVPVNPIGRPKGAVAGGRLRVIRRELKARCRYDRIPERFDLDVSEMDIGDFYKASAVSGGEGVEVLFEQDFNVLAVEGKKTEASATPEAEA